jgi:hemerythrin
MTKKKVAGGIFWVEIPEADLRILCGCPADSVKHLLRAGLISPVTVKGVPCETGPNAILLSDTSVQHGSFANLAEFPLLQMFYRQGMLIPGHPNNTGRRPLLIGLGDQVRSQAAYVFRGNYGLASLEEIEAAGASPTVAAEIFRVKKWFAFDRIVPTEELVTVISLNAEAVPLSPNVVVHRTGLNRYEFLAYGGSVEVDLNLDPGEEFGPPYALPPRGVRRERFSVVHIGEGDGWDVGRPCMGSIVSCDGLLYLVDAGPSITRTLEALSLETGDLEGIFQTHAHDDHFAGLPSLMRSERRLQYFAVPWVRASVEKKIAALMRTDEERLGRFFEVHDLAAGEWNRVGSMEVKPAFSPHPVENTVFSFRADGGKAPRTYAHFADIASRDVLARLALPRGGAGPALSAESRQRIEEELAAPVDVKKIDAGGGMIHGDPFDFAGDASGSIILSHGLASVPEGMGTRAKTVGFGSVDVLIPGDDLGRLRRSARASLAAIFPGVPGSELEVLADCPIRSYSPGAILEESSDVLLVLSGGVEQPEPGTAGAVIRRRAGALLGAPPEGWPPLEKARATGELSVLAVPVDTFTAFTEHGSHADVRRGALSRRTFMSLCPVFADVTSENVLNTIAASMEERSLRRGEVAPPGAEPELLLLADGELDLIVGAHLVESIGPGGFWGEAELVETAPVCEARAVTDCRYYAIPRAAIEGVPLLLWALQESFERRLRSFRAGFRFEWSESFRVDVRLLDDQHKELFGLANTLSELIGAAGTIDGHDPQKRELFETVQKHFADEEQLMALHQYPRLSAQKSAHEGLLKMLERFISAGERRARPRASTALDYLKDWLIRHTLLEDLQYRPFFAEKGVR